MTAKHTPGPWTAEPPNLDPDTGERPKYHWTIHATGERPCISFKLAEISTFNGSTDESDARLISAAPELLDAVQICLEAERERKKKLLPGAPATTYTEARIARIEAAIAKATGGDHE